MSKSSLVKQKKVDPRVKEVLKLLAAGVVLSFVILVPGLAALGPVLKEIKKEQEQKEWDKFNLWRLRQIIKRLENQKIVEIEDGIVKITEKGRLKALKFELGNMVLKKNIDGKWRLVIYDIANLRKPQRELFRSVLKRLQFLPLQKSVYLTPYICENEIEYLRRIFNVGSEVIIMKISGIENEEVYRRYFGL